MIDTLGSKYLTQIKEKTDREENQGEKKLIKGKLYHL